VLELDDGHDRLPRIDSSVARSRILDIVKQVKFGDGSQRRSGAADVLAAEHALERLFRLTSNRRLQSEQTAAIGRDVSRAGYAVLRCLDERGATSLGALARECAMDPAAAGRQVKLLESGGLVSRAAADDDARVALVRLTTAGRSTYRRIAAFRASYLTAVLSGWTASDRQALARLVDRLVNDLRRVPVRHPRGYR
jgi:DNA-binding MarR family transcriptional regulator